MPKDECAAPGEEMLTTRELPVELLEELAVVASYTFAESV